MGCFEKMFLHSLVHSLHNNLNTHHFKKNLALYIFRLLRHSAKVGKISGITKSDESDYVTSLLATMNHKELAVGEIIALYLEVKSYYLFIDVDASSLNEFSC